MRRTSVIMLLRIWVVGLLLMVLDQRARLHRFDTEMPLVRAQVRSHRQHEVLRQRDSAMAFAKAPITVTPTGETLRAVAYVWVIEQRRGDRLDTAPARP